MSPAARGPARSLARAASERYCAAGRYAFHFARGKLTHDPVFPAILAQGLLARRTHILDLGCGQGLLAAWLLAARRYADRETWPPQWPDPPRPVQLRGIELSERNVARARTALGGAVHIIAGDVRTADFGEADAIVILDVLHYIEYADQLGVLRRARRALSPDGVLLVRVGDAAAGFGFKLSRWVDRMKVLASRHGVAGLHCRPLTQWRDMLADSGFACESLPMSKGTPFANHLLVASPR